MPGAFDILMPKGCKKEVFQIEEHFLMGSNQSTEAFIRKTGKNDSYVYNHEVRTFQKGERITKKRQISGREYIELMDQRASGFRELKKFRQCFIYHNQHFIVETIVNADQQPTFIRFDSSKESNTIQFPDFVQILKEVTVEDIYASSSIAKIGWKMPEDDKKQILAKAKEASKKLLDKKTQVQTQEKKPVIAKQSSPGKEKPLTNLIASPPLSPRNLKKEDTLHAN